jgi:hypothetical protein
MISSTVPLLLDEWRSCFKQEVLSSLSNKELVFLVETCNEASVYTGSQLCTYLLPEQLPRLVARTEEDWASLQQLITSVVQASHLMQLPPPTFRKHLATMALRSIGPLGVRAEIAVASAYYQGLGLPAC